MDTVYCANCGHSGWSHGDQVDKPPPGVPCHAAIPPDYKNECPCEAMAYYDYDVNN